MRDRITIQRKSVTRGAAGSEVVTWTHVASVRAEVRTLSGADRDQYRLGQSQVTTEFRIRYQPGVTILPTMRVLWDDKPYALGEVLDARARRTDVVLLGYADAVK